MGAAGRGLLSFVLLIVTATAAYGGWANEYAAFGNDSLTFQGFATVSGGPAGSNGNVIHQGGIAHFDGLYGSSALNPAPPTAWNARQNVHGNVIFNSSVTINSLSNIDGSIHSGGAVSMGGNSIGKGVGGNVIATGPVTIESYNTIGGNIVAGGDATLVSGVNVAGNLGANGNVSLGVDSHVTGVVTRSGTLTLGGFSTVGGQAVGTVGPNPTAYTPVVLPPATAFTSGGANQNLAVFADVTLAPGSYGAVTLNGSNKLRLSGGNYYFDSIASPGTFADLHLDLTQGPINVFVTGDIAFDRVTAYVNGVRYDSAPRRWPATSTSSRTATSI